MNTLTLSPLGDLTLTRPASWVVIADLVISWPSDIKSVEYRHKLMRHSAATIGLAVTDDRLKLPKYRPATMDMMSYGESVLEVLIPRRVQIASIIKAGREVGDWLSDCLPAEQEVQEAADFTDGGARQT